MRSILGLFGKSPFGPLAKHTVRVHETVLLLRPLFEAFVEERWNEVEEIYDRISKLEHKADLLKNDIRDHLPRSLFLPVDRGDVLRFLKAQDRIADRVEDLGVLLTLRRTPTPEPIRQPVLDFVDAVVRTAEAWFEAAQELPTLQEASFTGPAVAQMLKRINEISDLEWEADKKQAKVSKQLFEHEAEIGAVSILLWTNIFRTLGSVANYAERTADFLRLMLARR